MTEDNIRQIPADRLNPATATAVCEAGVEVIEA
jgi:hypothetical protein